MKIRSLKWFYLIHASLIQASLVLLFSGCGSQSQTGLIALQIENARAPKGMAALSLPAATPNESLQVAQFKVTVTGDGMDPILVAADGSATEIEVLEIPAGSSRSVLIEATNSEGTVIRRRKLDGLEITPGVVTPVKTSLNTIPLILNLKPGSTVLAVNFKVIGFGEPGSSISITSGTSTSPSVSLNQSVENTVISPSLSDGLFEFIPVNFPLGKQTITLLDKTTGESSYVTVYIVPARLRPGTVLSAAGSLGPTTVTGLPFGRTKTANFPLIMKSLGQPQEEQK